MPRISMRLRHFSFPFLLGSLCLFGCQERPKELSEIVHETKPSVVELLAYDEGDTLIATGTGWFITPNEIITNRHVIEFATKAKVRLVSGAEYPVSYLAALNESFDIVRLGVDVRRENIRPLPVAVALPSEGERVVVIGNPLGLESTVTDGIVSSIRIRDGGASLIQISAPISAGSSGSPVVDLWGRVIGIATSQLKEGQNINFALPVACIDSLRIQRPVTLAEWRNDALRRKARLSEKERIRGAKISEATEWVAGIRDIKDSWDLTKVKESYFDRTGNLIQSIRYKKDGSVNGRTETVYDDIGREIEKREFDSTGVLVWRDSTSYVDASHRETYTWFEGDPFFRWIQKRFQDGTREITVDEYFDGQEQVKIDSTIVSRDQWGNVVEERSAASPNRVVSYQYATNGLKLQETERKFTGSQLSEEYVRIFDRLERVMNAKNLTPGVQTWEEMWFTYDKDGNQIEEVSFSEYLGIHYEKKVRTFDAVGNLKTEDAYSHWMSADRIYTFKKRRAITYKYFP